jgi:serine/threonine protein kinase
MGRLYSARDTELGRMVALRLVACDSHGEHSIREAQAASSLNHPNIVTIHDVIRKDRQTAIAMEFVEGCALSEKIGTPQPAGEVIRWGLQIARALAAAHGQGIVHGDIKPENLILRPDGYIKVLGFGLARREGHEAATAAGDIFALGCVLVELLHGRHPFDSQIDIAFAIDRQEPPPADVRCDAGAGMSALLVRMTAKDPSLRPQAQEVEHSLAAFVSSSSGSAPRRFRIPRRPGRRLKAILISTAAVAAAVGLALIWPRARKAPAEAIVMRFSIPMPPGIRSSSVTISP